MANSQNVIEYRELDVLFDEGFELRAIDWRVASGEHWLIAGANGAGKSALSAVMTGAGEIQNGEIRGVLERVGEVSFAAQAQLIAAELRKDDADILDVIAEGTPVRELIFDYCCNKDLAAQLVADFAIEGLLERAFRKLSTGESRKLMLIRALANDPQLLILDEPYEGLDVASVAKLQHHLSELSARVTMIFVLNRFAERPDFVTHIAYMQAGELVEQFAVNDQAKLQELQQLLHLKTSDLQIPDTDPACALASLDASQPLVKLSNISVKYTDNQVIDGLNWTINQGEHWQVTGPNGSGKTALLSLITGDHPQCYVNDINVFGWQRGNGESIWQIKQYIGYVSTALQWEYRVSTSVRNVIISGFYDSIGLYSQSSEEQRTIADQWLELLAMSERKDQPFNKLSYGDQRLLLIVRAMVKHPPLLILDEPCLGLDDMNRQLVLALIEKICAASSTTVIYVNHRPQDAIAGIERHLELTRLNA